MLLLAFGPLLLVTVASLGGLLTIGSKYAGVLWAFPVIVAYQFTKIRARWILAAFAVALGANHLVLQHVLLPRLNDPEMSSAVGAIVGSIMMGAACGLGFLVGHSTRKKRKANGA